MLQAMTTIANAGRKTSTHFEQIPLKIVKKIATRRRGPRKGENGASSSVPTAQMAIERLKRKGSFASGGGKASR